MITPKPIPQLTPEEVARFWSKVDKNGPVPPHISDIGECWTFTGNILTGSGYGYFHIWRGGKKRRVGLLAHRLSFYFEHLQQPKDLVLHRCDNRRCVRPSHLFEGTNDDNMRDMANKGRHRNGGIAGKMSGSNNPMSILTLEQVDSIRSEYAKGGVTQHKLAEAYGVAQSTISSIISNTNWSKLGDPISKSDLDRVVQENRRRNISRGSSHGRSILTEDQVRIIRKIGASRPVKSIAEEFGVSYAAISDILKRRNWAHLE